MAAESTRLVAASGRLAEGVGVVLIGMKQWQVPEAAEAMRPLLGEHTG